MRGHGFHHSSVGEDSDVRLRFFFFYKYNNDLHIFIYLFFKKRVLAMMEMIQMVLVNLACHILQVHMNHPTNLLILIGVILFTQMIAEKWHGI